MRDKSRQLSTNDTADSEKTAEIESMGCWYLPHGRTGPNVKWILIKF